MSRGGARNRSGPPADEHSINSARKGLVLTVLPAEGFRGERPRFPLPDQTPREASVWEEVWTLPQASMWAIEPWRHRAVAMWVRWSVRMEALEASAAVGNVVVRLADQIGLTPAGLKENGWKIAHDEVAGKRAEKAAPARSSKARLKVVAGGDAAE